MIRLGTYQLSTNANAAFSPGAMHFRTPTLPTTQAVGPTTLNFSSPSAALSASSPF